MPELSQRFRLNLPDTLACDTKLAPYFLKGAGLAVVQTETEWQNLLLTFV
jgi:hypothetical protein